MRMLEFGTVNFHNCISVAKENLRSGFDDASLSRAGRTEKDHSADGPIWRIHPGQKNLVEAAHAAHCPFLSYDSGGQAFLKVLGARALFGDEELVPVRGQLEVLLPQPEIDYCYLSSGYMFPRRDGIVLGGTWDHDDWSLTPNPEQATAILEGHMEIMKHLR